MTTFVRHIADASAFGSNKLTVLSQVFANIFWRWRLRSLRVPIYLIFKIWYVAGGQMSRGLTRLAVLLPRA